MDQGYNNRDIRFIKPCRAPLEGHRALTAAYALKVHLDGRVVQINLDNCSIQRMEQLPLRPTLADAETVGLLPLVHILQNVPPITLCAMGVNEMPDKRISNARLAYERFCLAFWPGHQDDAEASEKSFDNNSTDAKMEFKRLSEGERCAYGCAYVSLLQIQNIRRAYPSVNPIEQFKIYFHGVIATLDIVSAFELEIAKYAFWKLSENEINGLPEQIKVRRKDIKENFTALKSSLQKCREFAFNGAMDIFWLSGSNHSEDLKQTINFGFRKLFIDNWVGTNDIKLYRISEDIHSTYFNGSTMKKLCVTREDALHSSRYWVEVDSIAKNVLQHRDQAKRKPPHDLPHRIDRSVDYVERELFKLLPATQ